MLIRRENEPARSPTSFSNGGGDWKGSAARSAGRTSAFGLSPARCSVRRAVAAGRVAGLDEKADQLLAPPALLEGLNDLLSSKLLRTHEHLAMRAFELVDDGLLDRARRGWAAPINDSIQG